jgi:GNAT superfamily N-acetyltransferase
MRSEQNQVFSLFRPSYLQDLFVADSARGLGLGRALIEAVYEKAKADGCSRVHWLTQELSPILGDGRAGQAAAVSG